jgi:hypothetical protein
MTGTVMIHAGTYKTGSTALQAAWKSVRRKLALRGVAMPGLNATDSKHGNFKHELFLDRADTPRPHTARVVADIRAGGPDMRNLLTDEVLIGADPARLRDALAPAGARRTDVYFYVRPHVALASSLYLQGVKTGRAGDHGSDWIAGHGLQSTALCYIDRIDAFAAVFGDDAVQVREYDRAAFPGGSVVADAWDFLALPPFQMRHALAAEAQSNASPGLELAALLLSLSRHFRQAEGRRPTVRGRHIVQDLGRALSQPAAFMPATPFRFPLPVQERIADRFGAARRAFGARRLRRPPSAAWTDEPLWPRPDPDPIPAEPVQEAVAAIAAQRATRQSPYAGLLQAWLAGLPRLHDAGAPAIDPVPLLDNPRSAAA